MISSNALFTIPGFPESCMPIGVLVPRGSVTEQLEKRV